MTYADHMLNFATYGLAMLVLCFLIGGLVYASEARNRRRYEAREAREERAEREEVPPYPKKTSASA